jgi:O-antigen/teichoic acid export membrane protein
MLIGFIRSPIFTRYFTPEEYGLYSIVFVSYSIVSVFLFSWLSSGIWRFYNKYKNKGELNIFFSNLFFLYLLFSIVFTLVAVSWSFTTDISLMKKLTIFVFLQMVVSSGVNFILIVSKIEREAFKYNLIFIIKSVLSFFLQLYLTFRLDFRIEAIPQSTLFIELFVFIIILPGFLKRFKISPKYISFQTIKHLSSYTMTGIITGLGILILSSSDRYIIALLSNMDHVGIYNQVYNLSKISIMAVVLLFFSIINPILTKELEKNLMGTNKLISTFLNVYIIIVLPITLYFSLYAFQISNILLGEKFRVGYRMIPFVMFSSFVYGITLFFEARLKFSSNYKRIIGGFLFAAGLNILLNFIFIPLFNYQWAAFTTLVSYAILMVLFRLFDKKTHNRFSLKLRTFLPLIITLTIQLIIHLILNHYFQINEHLVLVLLEGVVFLIIYIFVILLFNKKDLVLFKRILN